MGSWNLGEPADVAVTAPIDLMAQLGGEVAGTLTMALQRVDALARTGHIDGPSLRALREEIELARRIGIIGQQVSRLAAGPVGISSDALDIDALLGEALRQRGEDFAARGLEVRRQAQPAEVLADAALCLVLIEALLDWALEHARLSIDFRVDHRSGPVRARLRCSFDRGTAEPGANVPANDTPPRLDTMSWRLLEKTATLLGLLVTRSERAGRTAATIEFPCTVAGSAAAAEQPAARPGLSRSLVGNQVLVMTARGDVQQLVREALRASGLLVDFVSSVDEARAFCRDGLPHAVVHEAVLGGPPFEHLRQELLEAAPTLAFVQITEDSPACGERRAGGAGAASVGRACIASALPAALVHELARRG